MFIVMVYAMAAVTVWTLLETESDPHHRAIRALLWPAIFVSFLLEATEPGGADDDG